MCERRLATPTIEATPSKKRSPLEYDADGVTRTGTVSGVTFGAEGPTAPDALLQRLRRIWVVGLLGGLAVGVGATRPAIAAWLGGVAIGSSLRRRRMDLPANAR